MLLINATKDNVGFNKAWNNKSNLVLNKCILALINKNQTSKETYAPFRDSKITRLMKPFFSKLYFIQSLITKQMQQALSIQLKKNYLFIL